MGCDIHAYVEYSTTGEHWLNLTNNAGHRNYQMFGIMAGIRCKDLMLFPPKGMPEGRLSYQTEDGFWRHVAPDDKPEWADSDGWVSRETAERWVNQGYSIADRKDDVLKRVSDPDAHSHSWLNADEMTMCVARYCSTPDNVKAPTEWVAIAAAMKAIEANGDMARLIFWFDN